MVTNAILLLLVVRDLEELFKALLFSEVVIEPRWDPLVTSELR